MTCEIYVESITHIGKAYKILVGKLDEKDVSEKPHVGEKIIRELN
jgi:hypothetical protein